MSAPQSSLNSWTIGQQHHPIRTGSPPVWRVRQGQVIAEQLGHADTRMTEKHYTHLAPSYVADTIRAHFPVLGITAETTVTPIRRRKLAFAGNNPRRIP
jgi:hypothetical protein